MTDTYKRAERVALFCLLLSLVFFGASFILGKWSGFFEITSIAWLALNTALVSFVLVIQFHQTALAEQEKLDIGQLKKDKESEALFEEGSEQQTLFAVAQKRLKFVEKWFIPIASGLIALYQIGIGIFLLNTRAGISFEEIQNRPSLVSAVYMTAIAFVSFLISRYATGLSKEKQWRPLRASGSLLLATALLSFITAIGLALFQYKYIFIIRLLGWIIPALLVVLGIENALNIIMDIYRPRIQGKYNRAAFDSRLLGIINEPGSMINTVSEAIDYQFGFKVSQTWFYKLLEKAIVPLVLFSALILYSLSCIVVISPNQEAVIEYFGNPKKEDGTVRKLQPGISLKLPWPIETVQKYPTKKINELQIGYIPKVDPETGMPERRPKIWGRKHYQEEFNLLVASPGSESAIKEGAAPVSLIMASVPVQYKVRDIYKFLYNNKDSEKLLEQICYRELTNFAANSKLEVENEFGSKNSESLLGAGRIEAKKVLTERIQKAADRANMGVEIVFVGLQGLHPPVELASDYQKVVGAVQKKEAYILNAMAERNKNLGTLAGSVEKVKELYQLVQEYKQLKNSADEEKIQEAAEKLDTAFANAKGSIYKVLQNAESDAYSNKTLAKATGVRFQNQLKSYQASKRLYSQEQRLQILEDSLNEIRKYVVVADKEDQQVFIIDMKDQKMPGLFELGGFQETEK